MLYPTRPSWLAPLALSLLVACGGGGGSSGSMASPNVPLSSDPMDAYPPLPAGTAPGASAAAKAAAATLASGINFGNMLEAPTEGEWGLKADDEFINLVGATGGIGKAVRLPVRWSAHASKDAAATIDPVFLTRVESVVNKLLARGATVVLNMHHYAQLDGDAPPASEGLVAAELVKPRFLAMWKQIAARFANADKQRLIFEPYNEPHGTLEAGWNDLFSRALRVIRETNPDRIVVVGPVGWNNASQLPKLVLPPDANLLLTVHHYEPFSFTHQGADWVSPVLPTGKDCCDATQLAAIRGPMDTAVAEAKRLGYPVFIGEFGAYSKAPLDARVRYLKAFRSLAAERGLPWMYWELASGFGVYDPVAHAFRPEIYSALYDSL